MPEIIEIEGDVARLVSKSITKQVPLDKLLELVEKVTPTTVPTIAKSQVFGHYVEKPRDGIRQMFVLCELQPGTRSITKYLKRRSPRQMVRYRLSMPYTFFWFYGQAPLNSSPNVDWSITSTRIFYSKEEYKDMNSKFIVAPLPNLSSAGEVCWGSTGAGFNQSLAKQLDERVNNWYVSEFNDDLDSGIRYPYGEPNMKRWVEESAADPMSWRNWPEFNDPDRQYKIEDLMRDYAVELPTVERFRGNEFIPEITLPMTFGRWEEFWLSIPAEQRRFGLRALENLREDDPANVPDEPVITEDTSTLDDGGVPV